jgi:hypothetical protein
MPYKSWFFLGISFGVLKSNWYYSETRAKSSSEEKESMANAIEHIEENILEETWKEDSLAYCINALQQLRCQIFNLNKKYNVNEKCFNP